MEKQGSEWTFSKKTRFRTVGWVIDPALIQRMTRWVQSTQPTGDRSSGIKRRKPSSLLLRVIYVLPIRAGHHREE